MNFNKDVPPGSWGPPESEDPESKVESPELKAKAFPDLVAAYSTFREVVKPKAEVVYHPASAYDISPSEAFPGSRVIYVELDEAAVRAIKAAGHEAHLADATQYDPGKVDVLILLNPVIAPDVPSKFVRPGGYVVANDYHKTASRLRELPDFQLKGTVTFTENTEKPVFDQNHPEQYWEEVDTEEAFRRAPFSFGKASYEFAARIVESVTGKQENVLVEYRRLLEQAKEEMKRSGEVISADSDVFWLTVNGHAEILAPLPRKKGATDDLFIFEKVTPQEVEYV